MSGVGRAALAQRRLSDTGSAASEQFRARAQDSGASRVTQWVAGGRARRRAVESARPDRRWRLLAAGLGVLRAGRGFPVGQPRVKRARLPCRSAGGRQAFLRQKRVRRRGPGAELLLHRRSPAPRRLHRRRPATECHPPPALQGGVRAVAEPGRVPVSVVLPAAAEASRSALEGRLVLDPIEDLVAAFRRGEIASYGDVVTRSK